MAHQRFERTSLAALNTLARLRSDSATPLPETRPLVEDRSASEWFDPAAVAMSRHYSRSEQRWEFRFFGASAVRTRSTEAYSEQGPRRRSGGMLLAPDDSAIRRSKLRSRYAMAGIVAVALAATMGLALPSGSGDRPGSVEITLPPPVAAPAPRRAMLAAVDRKPVTRKEESRPAIAGDARPAVQQASLSYSLDMEPVSSLPLDERAAIRAAIVKAFGSNDVQSWSDRGVEGVVVVGPAEQLAGRECRDVAILARGGGPDSETANSRKCVTSTGALVNP
jgi:hypothetical protein